MGVLGEWDRGNGEGESSGKCSESGGEMHCAPFPCTSGSRREEVSSHRAEPSHWVDTCAPEFRATQLRPIKHRKRRLDCPHIDTDRRKSTHFRGGIIERRNSTEKEAHFPCESHRDMSV